MLVAFEAIKIGEVHGGDEDDCRLLEARMLTDDLCELKTIDLRHAHVHQHNRHVGLEQFFEGVFGGRSLDEILDITPCV